MTTNNITMLNQTAAIAARDGVERGIANIEDRIKLKTDGINEAAKEYFVKRMKAYKAALEQLIALRGELNKRVFDAYNEETK